jgi:hypothetical protein
MFREYQAPFYVMAFRTREGMVLEARDSHRVVLYHVHQDHFSRARHTTHRTHSDYIAYRAPTIVVSIDNCHLLLR